MIAVYIILGAVIVFNLMLILFWHLSFKSYEPKVNKNIKVSVLIAARNEEKNIRGCLDAIIKQNYPSSNFEILVGDDMSDDNTAKIVSGYSNVTLVTISENIGFAKGKANVLAHLAKKAGGDVFLITDADVQPEKNWIASMVSYLAPSVGIINGTTAISNNILQHYEWIYSQGMIKVITDVTRPVTAIGNNMLVTREAYESTGGYENIEFSITEDFALYKAVKEKGYHLRQVVEHGVLAWSRSPVGLADLLHQRKRWIRGAIQLPLWIVGLLTLQGTYFPFLILALIMNPQWGLIIFVTKLFLQTIFIKSVTDKLNLKLRGGLILFEIYTGIIAALSIIFYLVPVRIRWKEREYK